MANKPNVFLMRDIQKQVPQYDQPSAPETANPSDFAPAVEPMMSTRGTLVAPPTANISFPPDMVYANSEEYKKLINEALSNGMAGLTPDEQKRVRAGMDQSSQLRQLIQQNETQRQAQKEQKDPEQAWLDRARSEFAKPWQPGMVSGLKVGVDLAAEVTKAVVNPINGLKNQIPAPISPYRNLQEQPLTDSERMMAAAWERLPPAEKAISAARRTLYGALSGTVEFFGAGLDPIINPEKYNMTHDDAIEKTAIGLTDMIRNAPDQVAYLAEVAFGTSNNPLTKLAEGVGTVANVGELVAGRDRDELKREAVNTLYTHPETLPFALMMAKGAIDFGKGKGGPSVAEQAKAGEAGVRGDVPDALNFGKTDYVAVKRSKLEEMQRDSQTLQTKQKAQKTTIENAGGDVTVRAIEESPTAELRTELFDMQKESSTPMTDIDIAKMGRAELEYRVSGGRTGKMPEKPKEAADALREEVKVEEPPKQEVVAPETPKANESAKVETPRPAQADVLRVVPDKWYRGVVKKQAAGGDEFYSSNRGVAEDFGKAKVGGKANVKEASTSELTRGKKIYEATDKEAIAEELGIAVDYTSTKFDDAVKEKLRSRGYDGIRYTEGTLSDITDGGAQELHLFGKADAPVPKSGTAKKPWEMTRGDYRDTFKSPARGDARTDAKIVDAVGSDKPSDIVNYYKDKYGITGDVRIQKIKGVSGKKGGISIRDASVAVQKHTETGEMRYTIKLPDHAKPTDIRHEIEHILDYERGFRKYGEGADQGFANYKHESFASDYLHRSAVKDALKRREPVPANVLADYPDLAKKPPKGETPKGDDLITSESPKQAEIVDTGNKPMDASRNLAHHRREFNENKEFLKRDDIPDNLRSEIEQRQKTLKADIDKYEAEFKKAQESFEAETKKASTDTFMLSRDKIQTDVRRFQMRPEAFAEDTAARIAAEGVNKAKLDPLLVWKDPKNGEYYVLDGHSRLEGLRRAGYKEDIPVREFKGTEAEAMEIADVRNLDSTPPGIGARAKVYRKQRLRGKTQKDLKGQFGGDAEKLKDLSYLDDKGKFLEIIDQRQEISEQFPQATSWARAVGRIKKRYPDLNVRHENQIFDQLYSDKMLHKSMNQPDLLDAVQKQVEHPDWNPDMPIKLRSDPRPMQGVRARPDTRKVVERLDELEKDLADARTGEERTAIEGEIKKAREALDELTKNQTTLLDLMPAAGPKTRSDIAGLAKRNAEIKQEIAQIRDSEGEAAVDYLNSLKTEYVKNQAIIDGFVEKGGESVGDGISYKAGGIGIVSPISGRPTLDVVPITTRSTVSVVRPGQDFRTIDYFRSPSLAFRALNENAGNVADLGHSAMKTYGSAVEKANTRLNEILYDLRSAAKEQYPGFTGYFKYRKEFANAKKSVFDYLDRKVTDQDLAEMKPEIRKAYKEIREWYDGYRDRIIEERRSQGIETPDDWGIKDYITHLFRGNWRVREMVDGKWQTVGGGIAETEAAAFTKAREILEADPARQLQIAWDTGVPLEMGTKLSRGSFFRLLSGLERKGKLSPKEVSAIVRDMKIGISPGKSKHYKFSVERKGLEGYNTDLVEVLETYAGVTERWLAMNKFRREAVAQLEKIDKGTQPQLYKQVEQYIDAVAGTRVKGSAEFDNLIAGMGFGKYVKPMAMERWLAMAQKAQAYRLLSKPSSALGNKSQTFQTVYPRVGEAIYGWGVKAALQKKWRDFAEQYDVTTFSPKMYAGHTLSRKGIATRTSDKPMYLFNKAEQQNHIEAFLMGYKYAKDVLHKGEVESVAYGKGMVRLTQFDNSVADIQGIFRHPLARTVFQFKPFQLKFIEQFIHMSGKEKLRAVIATGIVGGLKTVASPVSWLVALGMPTLYTAIRDDWGEDVANFISYGLPGLIGADMSGFFAVDMLGYGNTFKERLAATLLGPSGAFAYDVANTVGDVWEAPDEDKIHTVRKGTEKVFPFVRPISSAWDLATNDVNITDMSGRTIVENLSARERFARLLGLSLIRQSLVYDMLDLNDEDKKERSGIKRNAWAAYRDGNYEKMVDVVQQYNDDLMGRERFIAPINGVELSNYIRQQMSEEVGPLFDRTIPKYNQALQEEIDRISEGK